MKRLVFILLTILLPFLALALLEGALRLAGFGQTYPLFVPETEGYLRVNRHVVRRFMVREEDTPNLWIRPVYFRPEKEPDTIRIFVQGGSSAEGYPYGYGASPAGMLDQRLQRTFPDLDVEVVTTAMSAVNTYTLLDFQEEILEQRPDAVVIYAGHNEWVGLLGVGSGFTVGRRRPVVRTFLAVKDWRIFQLVRRAVQGLVPEPPRRDGDRTLMATIVAEKRIPLGSPLYERGLEQFRANLTDLLARYRRAGVPVFIGTLASNERDQPPFVSGHRPGISQADVDAWSRHFRAGLEALLAGDPETALEALDQALEIDDFPAEGHFRRGKALDALGRHEEARQAYLAAKDRDELRFRAPEDVQAILRQVAAEQEAHLVEVRQAFVDAARDGIIGHDLMLEHLHPNLDGYFVLADAFYDALHAEEFLGSWDHPIADETARREMPVTEVDRLYGEYRIRRLTSDWPFTERKRPFRIEPAADPIEEIAQDFYRGRVEWPDAMRQLLQYHRSTGNGEEAARVAVLLAEAFPYLAADQTTAAALLGKVGRPEAQIYTRRARLLGRAR